MVRAVVGALSLFVAAGLARADDAYTLPAVGAQLTFRLMSTTKLADQTVVTGQIYTYTVTAISGVTSVRGR